MNSLVIDTQKLERKEYKYTAKENDQTRKKLKEEKMRPTRINNKMTISRYLSIITVNVNGNNVPIKRQWVADQL